MPDLPEVITPDLVSRADVINQLLTFRLDPSLIAQVLRVDISEVRRVSGFTDIQDSELAQGVATLFQKVLGRVSFDLDFAHPEAQQVILVSLLNSLIKRYSGGDGDQTSEMRVTLERLLTSETSPPAPDAVLTLDALPGPGPEARDPHDQRQGRVSPPAQPSRVE